jgi:hypothetical protein
LKEIRNLLVETFDLRVTVGLPSDTCNHVLGDSTAKIVGHGWVQKTADPSAHATRLGHVERLAIVKQHDGAWTGGHPVEV